MTLGTDRKAMNEVEGRTISYYTKIAKETAKLIKEKT